MPREKTYYLSKEKAKELLVNAVEEVYSHRPVRFKIALSGALEELPMLHVYYDGHAYCVESENGEERRTDAEIH